METESQTSESSTIPYFVPHLSGYDQPDLQTDTQPRQQTTTATTPTATKLSQTTLNPPKFWKTTIIFTASHQHCLNFVTIIVFIHQ